MDEVTLTQGLPEDTVFFSGVFSSLHRGFFVAHPFSVVRYVKTRIIGRTLKVNKTQTYIAKQGQGVL